MQEFNNAVIYDFTKIRLRDGNEGLGCYCDCFCNENIECISAWEVLQTVKYKRNESFYYPLYDACKKIGVDMDEFERFILALATMDKNLSKKMVKGDKYMDELLEKQEELTLSADLRQSYDHELAMKKWGIEEGIEQTKKEATIELHKNGVSDDLIIKSLHITREKLEEYLNKKQLQEEK